MINMFDRLKCMNKIEEFRIFYVFLFLVSKSCCEFLFIIIIVWCVVCCGLLNGIQVKLFLGGIVSFIREDKNNNIFIDFMGSILVYLI